MVSFVALLLLVFVFLRWLCSHSASEIAGMADDLRWSVACGE